MGVTVTARLAVREAETVLPEPLTPEQLKAGHRPPYEPRKLHTDVMPVTEALQWLMDCASAGAEPILQFALQRHKDATLGDAAMGLLTVDRSKGLALVERLLRYTSVTFGGRRVELSSRAALDDAFTGELLLLVHVLQWVAKVNLESFTRGLPATKPTPAAKTETSSE